MAVELDCRRCGGFLPKDSANLCAMCLEIVVAEEYEDEPSPRDLLMQAYNEWTPTQGPTDAWLRSVKKIKENR